jgi:hypothetical protein
MRISTQAKLISTALVALAIAAPIAHGETDGTLLSRASQNAALTKTNPGTVSDGTLLSKAAGLPGHQSSSAIYPGLKAGEGFSFKAPSYWNAGPSYWSTAQRTGAPITPRVRVNRSLGVPAQYLGTGTQTKPGTPRAGEGSAGFDWSAAAIGAGIVAALFLMIAGIGAMTIRARKSQRAGRLSAT